jgi:hypothetical protein
VIGFIGDLAIGLLIMAAVLGWLDSRKTATRRVRKP